MFCQSSCAFIHVPPLNRPYSARQLADSIRVAVLAMLAQVDGRDQASLLVQFDGHDPASLAHADACDHTDMLAQLSGCDQTNT